MLKKALFYGVLFVVAYWCSSILFQNNSGNYSEVEISALSGLKGDYSGYINEADEPIVLYTSISCDACKKIKRELLAHQVSYTEYTVEENDFVAQNMAQLGISGVPIVITNDTLYFGYSPDTITKLANDS